MYFLDLTFRSLIALIKGNVSIKELAGPIMIAKIAGETASAGLNALLGLMAFISINLGLVNILPIPGLDGGHVIIALIASYGCKNLAYRRVFGMAIAGSLVFFLITNFGVWASIGLYPLTAIGLMSCYVAGLPFLKGTMVGDLAFTGIVFGAFVISNRTFKAREVSVLK